MEAILLQIVHSRIISPLALVVYILILWTNIDVLFNETMLFILITEKGKQSLGD